VKAKVGLLAMIGAAACTASGPAVLDTRNDACAWCRMAVSDPRFAAQLVLPGEDAVFFDDIGCMADYLLAKGEEPSGARAWVADHRTKEWVEAGMAVYTRVGTLEAPMRSHLVAHVDAASRDADPDARGGVAVSASELFGKRLTGSAR
jgi:copper chaperone NosL